MPSTLTKMCSTFCGPNPPLDIEDVLNCRRTFPIALPRVHTGFSLLTLIAIVPVGGFKAPLTHV